MRDGGSEKDRTKKKRRDDNLINITAVTLNVASLTGIAPTCPSGMDGKITFSATTPAGINPAMTWMTATTSGAGSIPLTNGVHTIDGLAPGTYYLQIASACSDSTTTYTVVVPGIHVYQNYDLIPLLTIIFFKKKNFHGLIWPILWDTRIFGQIRDPVLILTYSKKELLCFHC